MEVLEKFGVDSLNCSNDNAETRLSNVGYQVPNPMVEKSRH